ncbi:MAG: EAL domain-containing protein [Pseudolabrys sp.]|jgi:diguanylate cyclase (GGDEF)-like protein/PAS domain S-box-containing protein
MFSKPVRVSWSRAVKQFRSHIFVSCLLAFVLLTGMHSALQNTLNDMRFSWVPRAASGNVVLVAIDSPSIEKIGVWPWPRRLHAELLDKLVSAEASDIVFDVDFSSPSNPTFDQAFVDALQRAEGSVVLPAFKQSLGNGDNGKTIYVNRPLPQFGKHAWSATANVAIEPDGIVRHYSYGETLDGSFLPSVGALLGGNFNRREQPFKIDFSIDAASLPTVSYVDVLRGNFDTLKKFKHKKIIIGATAIELGDRFNVPNGHVVPGATLQALAVESILQGRALHTSSNIVTLGGLGVVMLLMVALWRRVSVGIRVTVLVGLAIAIELGAIFLQAKLPIVIDTSLWHAAIAAYIAALTIDEVDFRGLMMSIAERRFQRIAMSLGDGLVCTDRNGLITVWNPGAVAIFGYELAEMIGQPLDRICASSDGVRFSTLEMPLGAFQAPGGKVMELEGRRKNGETFPLEACFSEWQGIDGFQYGAVMRDISVRTREAERIRYLAEHDTLTGLANRNKLHEQLDATLAEAKAEKSEVALLMVDLDKFKQINDTLGHACGDELLCGVAARLKDLVGGAGMVARLGGDEFAVVIGGADVTERAKKLSKRTSLAFSQTPFAVGARQLRVNVSIGIAVYPKDCGTVDGLLGNADLALYHAKAAGRGGYVFFEHEIRDKLESRLSLEADLGRAIEKDEFELYYQPQVNLEDGKLVGAEALIRWRHPNGLVLPNDFMPAVNASMISDGIALWVLETACRQGCMWQRKGHDIRLSVNLSPSQFQLGDLAATVVSVLRDTGFSPSLLELEVTESILLEDDERALEIFRLIRDLGVRIAFDDFGTGYAGLTYLKKFPLDRLKIDKSFVSKLEANSDDMAIVGATISLGKLLGLSVIAEGIEDRVTADLLRGRGCEEGQGYYFGRPMPATEFEQRFLSKEVILPPSVAVAAPGATAA